MTQTITGIVRSTDGRHPVARVEMDTRELGIVSYRIPYGQSVGYGIDNSEFRESPHVFRVDGRHLLAIVREDA